MGGGCDLIIGQNVFLALEVDGQSLYVSPKSFLIQSFHFNKSFLFTCIYLFITLVVIKTKKSHPKK